MNKNVVIGLGIGCAVLCIVCIIIAIAGGAFIKWLLEDSIPENANISVDAPILATKGEPVIIELRVENTATEPQLLQSVDITLDYLAGIAIEETDPPFLESWPIPFSNWHSYRFEQEVAPGATLVVQFFGVAVATGDFSGMIDVCINSGDMCASFVTRTIVEE